MSEYFELIVNWFLNLLVPDVIEKVQMKPPNIFLDVKLKSKFMDFFSLTILSNKKQTQI